MADTTLNLLASSYRGKRRDASWVQEIALPAAFSAGVATNFISLRLHPDGRVRVQLSGAEFSDAVETSGVFTLTVGTRTIDFGILGADLIEPYEWLPSNSAEFIALYNALPISAGGTAATLVLRDGPATAVEASAGGDKTVTSGGKITLDGSATVTGGVGATTYAWTRVSGVGGAISAANVARPEFTAPVLPIGSADRPIVWRLTATNNGISDTDDVTVTVELPAVRLASRLPVEGTGSSELTVIQPVRLASRLPVEGLGSVARLVIDYHSASVRLVSRLPVEGLGSSRLITANPVRLVSRLPVQGLGSSELIAANPVRLASRLPVEGLGSVARLAVEKLVRGRFARLDGEWVEVSPTALARADIELRQGIQQNADSIVAEAQARTELQAQVEGTIATAVQDLTVQVRSLGFDADYDWLAATKAGVNASGRLCLLSGADYAAASATRTHAGIVGAGALLVHREQADGSDLRAAWLALEPGQSLSVELAGGRRYVYALTAAPSLPAGADVVLIPLRYQSHEGATTTLASGAGAYGLRVQRVDRAMARWLVQTRVGDLVGGIGFYNDGRLTSLIAAADRFAILQNADTLEGLAVPFTVQGGKVYIDVALIRDGTISHLKAGAAFIENLVATQGRLQQAWIEQGNIFNLALGNVIQSDNYRAGVRGWRVTRDGQAEFAAAAIRGEITAARAAIADALTATAISALRIDASQMNTGTLSALRILLNGQMLTADAAGRLGVKDGGIGTGQVAGRAVTNAVSKVEHTNVSVSQIPKVVLSLNLGDLPAGTLVSVLGGVTWQRANTNAGRVEFSAYLASSRFATSGSLVGGVSVSAPEGADREKTAVFVGSKPRAGQTYLNLVAKVISGVSGVVDSSHMIALLLKR